MKSVWHASEWCVTRSSMYIPWGKQGRARANQVLVADVIEQYAVCPGGGEDSAYERGGDARRKFWIEPLKETDLGGAQAFFDP